MELTTDEPGVIGQLDHLDQPTVGRLPGQAKPELCEHIAVGVADLPPVPVALGDLGGAGGRGGQAPRR